MEKGAVRSGAFSCFCPHVLLDYVRQRSSGEERKMKALASLRSLQNKKQHKGDLWIQVAYLHLEYIFL